MKKTIFGNYKAKSVEQHLEQIKEEHLKEVQEKNTEIATLSEKCTKYERQVTEIGEAIVYAKSFIVQSKQRLEEEERELRDQIHANHQLLKNSIQTEIDQLIQKRSEIEKEYLEFQLLVQKNVSHFNSMLSTNQHNQVTFTTEKPNTPESLVSTDSIFTLNKIAQSGSSF